MVLNIDRNIMMWSLIFVFAVIGVLFLLLIYRQIVKTAPLPGRKGIQGSLLLGVCIGGFTCSILLILSIILGQGKILSALFFFMILAPLFLPITIIAGILGFYYRSKLLSGQMMNGVQYYIGKIADEKNKKD